MPQDRANLDAGGSDIIAGASAGYRVVYGETIPAWERIFPTLREAKAFAREHEGFGDVIFNISKVFPGQKPQSLAAAIKAGAVEEFIADSTKER